MEYPRSESFFRIMVGQEHRKIPPLLLANAFHKLVFVENILLGLYSFFGCALSYIQHNYLENSRTLFVKIHKHDSQWKRTFLSCTE